MTLTKYLSVKPEYKSLITSEMMLAREGCRRCHGRGHVGYNIKRKCHIPCDCVMVNVDMLNERLKEVARQIQTNIPSLQTSPLEDGAVVTHLEAPSGNES